MTLREFLEQVVIPNVTDLEGDYGNLRKSINAVHSVDALAAHIYVACGGASGTGFKDDTAFRQHLCETDCAFLLIRDIAKALKHVELTRGTPSVQTAQAVNCQSLGWGETRWGEGRWGSPPQIVVESTGGEKRVVESVVKRALKFLEDEMNSRGL